MATLHVRNIPERLYKRIQKLADEENRSLTAEVVQLLGQGIKLRETRREAGVTLEHIGQRAQKTRLPATWQNSTDLLREDRSR